MLRTINNATRSLLFQASMPPSYWVEALHTATHVLNLLPTKTLQFSTPHLALFGTPPQYDHLRVFGCTCYPNLSATTAHKLAPRSSLCTFLGYSPNHKGYRCLDLQTNRVILSRHVVFDEHSFPFAQQSSPPEDLDFLTDYADPVPQSIGTFFSPGPPTGAQGHHRAPLLRTFSLAQAALVWHLARAQVAPHQAQLHRLLLRTFCLARVALVWHPAQAQAALWLSALSGLQPRWPLLHRHRGRLLLLPPLLSGRALCWYIHSGNQLHRLLVCPPRFYLKALSPSRWLSKIIA
jgi:hypothetical protein